MGWDLGSEDGVDPTKGRQAGGAWNSYIFTHVQSGENLEPVKRYIMAFSQWSIDRDANKQCVKGGIHMGTTR